MNYQQHITLALSAIDDEIEELRTKRQRLIDAMGWEAAPDDGETLTVLKAQALVPATAEDVADFGKAAAPSTKPGLKCPECGVVLATERGLKTHRGFKHKVKPPVSYPKAVHAPPQPAPQPASGPKVLACSECDFTADVDDVKKLSAHAITTHKRPPLPAERTPVVAA